MKTGKVKEVIVRRIYGSMCNPSRLNTGPISFSHNINSIFRKMHLPKCRYERFVEGVLKKKAIPGSDSEQFDSRHAFTHVQVDGI